MKKEEMSKTAGSDDIQIAPFREDEKRYGTPTWIWSVVDLRKTTFRKIKVQR